MASPKVMLFPSLHVLSLGLGYTQERLRKCVLAVDWPSGLYHGLVVTLLWFTSYYWWGHSSEWLRDQLNITLTDSQSFFFLNVFLNFYFYFIYWSANHLVLFFFKFYYLFLAVLGCHCCTQTVSSKQQICKLSPGFLLLWSPTPPHALTTHSFPEKDPLFKSPPRSTSWSKAVVKTRSARAICSWSKPGSAPVSVTRSFSLCPCEGERGSRWGGKAKVQSTRGSPLGRAWRGLNLQRGGWKVGRACRQLGSLQDEGCDGPIAAHLAGKNNPSSYFWNYIVHIHLTVQSSQPMR